MLCDQMVFPRFALSLKTAQGGSTHLNFKTILKADLRQCFPTFKGYGTPLIQTEVCLLILKLYSTFSLTLGPIYVMEEGNLLQVRGLFRTKLHPEVYL